MDTNLSLALKMAAGVLIALIIISAVTLLFNNINPSQQQLEDIKALEQTADFNKEYEVYNKSLMLGTDIISLINKAYSNNRAYIDAYGYSDDLEDNYLIDVQIPPVEVDQTLEIKKVERDVVRNKYIEVPVTVASLSETSRNEIKVGLKITEALEDNYPERNIGGDSLIVNNAGTKYINEDVNYNLIIEQSRLDLKRTAKNPTAANIAIAPEDTEWYIATIYTYVYDFKSKKFRCTNVGYSDITGRINSLTFELIQ